MSVLSHLFHVNSFLVGMIKLIHDYILPWQWWNMAATL